MQTEKIQSLLSTEHGFFNSATIAQSPQDVFEFCRNNENVQKVLRDLPLNLENFLDLTLVKAEETDPNQFRIEWQNSETSKAAGTLYFLLSPAPLDRGTILIAEASFDIFDDDDSEPSDLIKVFLKRMKALAETGVIATTTGQPSGREEITFIRR